MDEQRTKKIIDEILKRNGHIYDTLHWLEQPKGTPMPQSLKDYFDRALQRVGGSKNG